MHSTNKFRNDSSEQVSVCVCVSHGWLPPPLPSRSKLLLCIVIHGAVTRFSCEIIFNKSYVTVIIAGCHYLNRMDFALVNMENNVGSVHNDTDSQMP